MMRVLSIIALFAAVFAGGACYKCEGSACKGLPPAAPDYPPIGVATCERACMHLSELGCPESRITPGGTTCPTACRRASQLVDMDLECVVSSRDRDEVRACGTVRCRD
jgi:hypothetical protein